MAEVPQELKELLNALQGVPAWAEVLERYFTQQNDQGAAFPRVDEGSIIKVQLDPYEREQLEIMARESGRGDNLSSMARKLIRQGLPAAPDRIVAPPKKGGR